MTEPKPLYLDTTAYACQGCGVTIGHYTAGPDGRTWLLLPSGHIVTGYHGRCTCGAAVHFVSSDVTFERIMARRRRFVIQFD